VSLEGKDNVPKCDLLAIFKDLLEKEKCCEVQCECAIAGIKCHYDVCGCYSRESLDNTEGVDGGGGGGKGCGNGKGCRTFDGAVGKKVRKEQMKKEKWGDFCVETS